jgi:hypothetical protein
MIFTQPPDKELIKELYATFGLAHYHSECLHRELCNKYLIATFESPSYITRPRVEEKLAHAYSLTLGEITKQFKHLVPHKLFSELNEVVEKRNFLAHHFWFERAHLMLTAAGVHKMLHELNELSELFSDLDKKISMHFEPKRKELGLTDEILQAALNDVSAGRLLEPLPQKRKFKKQERLVRVWEVPLPSKAKTLVFETDDGCRWQLCDVGLGWTYHDTVESSWKENKEIQRYLPANINPRPKHDKRWHFQFKLAKGAIFWVKPGRAEFTFHWGIKRKP